MDIKKIFEIPPYSLDKRQKSDLFNDYLFELTQHHYQNCYQYEIMLNSLGYDINKKSSYTEIPFLPVRLFKMFELRSIPVTNILKTMTSSGTSGQDVSKIFLDKETSVDQTRALSKIVSTFLDAKRSPMIIIDSESILKNRNLFSARGAGIIGFSMFGSKRLYALNENMEIDVERLVDFVNHYQNDRIFLFGFTFMIYQHFIQELEKNKVKLDLSNAVLIHGGGWKKLINKSISNVDFKNTLDQLCGINSVHDYYGMVEQTGSIYMECENGHLHSSVFSDIIIRDPYDFSIAPPGQQGIIQTLSLLPKSYPGHSLLSEDEGILLGEDDCSCGRLGKYFKITGRIKNAEIRGCSDTYAEQY